MKIMSQDEFLQGGSFENETQTKVSQPKKRSAFADLSIGFAKGVGDTAIGLGTIGRGIQSVLPEQIQGIKQKGKPIMDDNSVFDMGSESNINTSEMLKADNPTQKAGKVLEFAAEVLFPVSKLPFVSKGAAKTAETVGASFENLGNRIGSIADSVAEGSSQVKEKLIDAISSLDDKTKTALTRTPKDVFMKVVEQGKNAMMDDRNRTPLEAVGDSVIKGIQDLSKRAATIGEKKTELMKLNGIKGFVGDGIQKFNEGVQSFINSKTAIAEDRPVLNAIVKEFKKLGGKPSTGQVDKFIDFAQEQLYSAERNLTLPTSSGTIQRLRGLIGQLNEKLKSQLPESYRVYNKQFSDIQNLTSELNLKLGKEGANAGSLIKRLFSPSDARTKELFELLQKETGQDYFRDARLAKFIMDTLGDKRAASILEQLPTPTPSGLIGKGLDVLKNKLSDPIDAAKRFIDKNPQSKAQAGQAFAGAIGATPDENGNVNSASALAGLVAAGFTGKVTPQKVKEAKSYLDGLYKRFIKTTDKTAKERLRKEYIRLTEKFNIWKSKGRQ